MNLPEALQGPVDRRCLEHPVSEKEAALMRDTTSPVPLTVPQGRAGGWRVCAAGGSSPRTLHGGFENWACSGLALGLTELG